MSKIIIVAAHPDDETLGAGGTLLKHIASGDQVYWLIVTEISSAGGYSEERVTRRKKEIDTVARRFGFSGVFNLNFPTMSLSGADLTRLIPQISEIFSEVQPEIVYAMNRSDAHSDHRIIFDAVAACTKSFRYPFIKKFLMYECISETEFAPALPEKQFLPNYFVDITEFLDEKISIMEEFASEVDVHPFPRSLENIKALAIFRGASVGVVYAEAFQLLKFIDKK